MHVNFGNESIYNFGPYIIIDKKFFLFFSYMLNESITKFLKVTINMMTNTLRNGDPNIIRA
ncbi:hypothetical protein C2G38_2081015 [Gigaspora rosea]|uniref:Uncharacterized protein n=1 Tax=Gigaspora rosea TaxID=44941 RepID=A0A397VGB7_9GLOM|nr:hypothetical protein C2G38_2081015 [Gigaspora rosea]